MNKAIILDRDGTIVKDGHYLKDPNKLRVYKGVVPALKLLKEKGWKIIIGTNQSGIGRGYFTLETLEKIHKELHKIFRKNHLQIDEIYFCPHHPNDKCHCRKPNLGMLQEAAKKHHLNLESCIVIGDKECDIQWGKNGGAKTILVLTGKGKKARLHSKARPDHISPTLPKAVQWILKHG